MAAISLGHAYEVINYTFNYAYFMQITLILVSLRPYALNGVRLPLIVCLQCGPGIRMGFRCKQDPCVSGTVRDQQVLAVRV